MRVSFANRSGLISLLLVFCFFTFFLGLGSQAITDADEAFYAEASREMVESGDWLTPRFNYQHRWEKPVLYYWLTAATYLATGPNEFAARLWSALSGVGLALLAWAIARHATSRLDVAWLAGTIVATSFGYFAMARAALPDLPLTFCITLTIWAALRAIDVASERRAGPSGPATKWWVLAGASAGAGFLMKGPVALVVPALVLLPIAWREWRRLRLEIRGMAVAVVTAAIVGLPWYVAMWLEHGNPYLQSFFVADNFERFATERFNEARPFWFYLPVLLGGLLPWSLFLTVFVVEGLAGARKRTLKLADADWRLLLWAIMPLLFFTLSVGKQPRYILPVLPPLAVLLARGLIERIDDRTESPLVAQRGDVGDSRDVHRARPAVRADGAAADQRLPGGDVGRRVSPWLFSDRAGGHRRDCGRGGTCRSSPVSRESSRSWPSSSARLPAAARRRSSNWPH